MFNLIAFDRETKDKPLVNDVSYHVNQVKPDNKATMCSFY